MFDWDPIERLARLGVEKFEEEQRKKERKEKSKKEREEKLKSLSKEQRIDFIEKMDKEKEALEYAGNKEYEKWYNNKRKNDRSWSGNRRYYNDITIKKEHIAESIEAEFDKKFNEEIEKLRAENEKKRIELEKQKAKELRISKKKGLSNIKPYSFYDKLYCRYSSPFGFKRFYLSDEEYKIMQEEREYDIYFEEKGIPNKHDYRITTEKPIKYKTDSPEENQKYLNSCKELLEIFKVLDVDLNNYYTEIEIYQEYLDKNYLITRQIIMISKNIGRILWEELDYKTRKQISHFYKHNYKIDIFDDESFNIEEIKHKVNEFINGKEVKTEVILTPIEYLREFLKKNNNRITIVRYASLINKSYKVALRILKGFVSDKKLKVKKEAKGKLIFYL